MSNIKTTNYHFIGVGGIGMSGLAELLVRRGHRVSGSDLAAGPLTRRLETLGLSFHEGHRPEQLPAGAIVVHSTAVKEDNPELAAARARGLTVMRRGQLLARLMEGHLQVAVTGAHGKTSTTAMVAAILRSGGLDPTVVVGAWCDLLGSNAVLGGGGYFVAEADESDGSFAYLSPQVTVVTNLDREHLDHYRDLAHIQETFAAYFQKLPPGAQLVACADDPHLAPLLPRFAGELTTYGLSLGADFRATEPEPKGLGCSFRLWYRGRELGRVTVPLAGGHYVLNAMAACAVGHNLGLKLPVWRQGLKGLGQIQRRCQVKGTARGVLVLDDYGHHPTEISATLKGLTQAFPRRRLVVAFQPHRYSRTAALMEEFTPIFARAGIVFITEIYGAGEPPREGVSGRAVYEGVRGSGHPAVHFVAEKSGVAAAILKHVQKGDLVLTLGAGDIWTAGEDLLARLNGKAASSGEARP
ncbi:MAG: UDP-N-acetylmuramate--L-alanine ligase [Desulfobaccales bacterium]